MRVNIYAEEMTDRVEIVTKEIDGTEYTGVRFYLELPVTKGDQQHKGPFVHRPGDDDSAAVTFWGKRDLRNVLGKAIDVLDRRYSGGMPHSASSVERRAFYAGTREASKEGVRRVSQAIDALSEMPLAEAADYRKGLNEALGIVERLARVEWPEHELDRAVSQEYRCRNCSSCRIEQIGCACDGAIDDGCFLCTPELHTRPPCTP